MANRAKRRADIPDERSQVIKALEREYRGWDVIKEYGCHDPFWSDGSSMNLVRNHIIYYKTRLLEMSEGIPLPDVYYRALPPVVDDGYMAQKGKYFEVRCKRLYQQEPDKKIIYKAPELDVNGELFSK